MVRRILIPVLMTVMFLSIGAGRLIAADPPIDGVYKCVGDNGSGASYEGTVRISKIGETYEIKWVIAGQTHVGVGFFENDRLCCSYAVPTNDGVITGVAVYKVERNKLTGRWASYPGTGKVSTETLIKAE